MPPSPSMGVTVTWVKPIAGEVLRTNGSARFASVCLNAAAGARTASITTVVVNGKIFKPGCRSRCRGCPILLA
jgi:hypothetical protein